VASCRHASPVWHRSHPTGRTIACDRPVPPDGQVRAPV
jgi:hypothetical protein